MGEFIWDLTKVALNLIAFIAIIALMMQVMPASEVILLWILIALLSVF